jgi:hypothetical protein
LTSASGSTVASGYTAATQSLQTRPRLPLMRVTHGMCCSTRISACCDGGVVPEEVTAITRALNECLATRDAIKLALLEALSPSAHYALTTAVSGITQILTLLESARQADAE